MESINSEETSKENSFIKVHIARSHAMLSKENISLGGTKLKLAQQKFGKEKITCGCI